MIKQKDVFLQEEGNVWFDRNHATIQSRDLDQYHDPVIFAVQRCMSSLPLNEVKLLEIGCGEAKRLQWIKKNLGIDCYGIDPSEKAVATAQSRGVHAVRSTADQIPFEEPLI